MALLTGQTLARLLNITDGFPGSRAGRRRLTPYVAAKQPADTVGEVKATPGTVQCTYCAGHHDRAADVRACWERSTRPAEPSIPRTGPAAVDASIPIQPTGTLLGRSVVVAPGQAPPGEWAKCERAGGEIDELERAWRERTPLVIEVSEEPPDDEIERSPVWSLTPQFAFPGERRAHATFANSVDARGVTSRWRWKEEGVLLGATAAGPADVVLPDGRPAYCDGGPLMWMDSVAGAVVVPRLALLAGSLLPFGTNDTDAPLALDQLAAVTHVGGAARIIAPAGSGKTRVLTERARHLLRSWNLPGRSVTLVAFNKRAANEMKERTPDLPELQVRTLNALGLSLVARSGSVATIEEREVRSILDKLVDLPRRTNTDPAAAWIEALSAVRLGLQAPAEVEAEFQGDVDGLPEVFERYRSLLAERRVVDFDEQVYRSIEILLTDPAARRSARAACRVLLVDEFQDLTPAHLLLIRLLAGPEGAVFGVGDDDQTIYGYSGASPKWLIDYRRFFPGAGEHALEVNYRCPPPVVDATRTLLTHNRRRVQKNIVAPPDRQAAATELEVHSGEDALAQTVGLVDDLVTRGAKPSQVAVLTRVNASLAPVQVALVHREIPVRPAVDESYLLRGGVQAALAWLRLAVSPSGRLADADIASAARRPSRGLSPKAIEWMSEQGDSTELERLAGRLGPRDAEKIRGFVSDLHTVRRTAASGTTAAVLRAVRDDIGLDRAMELLESARRQLNRSAQTDDLDALVALGALHPDPDGFEDWLRQSLRHPGSVEGVVLATIHSVKGREWPHVVLHEVSAGLMPHRLATDIEEERRVFHVGLTRASSSVCVVSGDQPSPFIAELLEEWTPGRPPFLERQLPAEPPGPRQPKRTKTSSTTERRPPKEEPELVPKVGVELEHGGHRQRIVAIDDEGVVAVAGRARMRVRYGELVTVEGRLSRLVPQPAPAAVVERAREALRAWRSRQAAAEGKPAFVFLHDRTLEALATSVPTNMTTLANVRGIGPAKLEAYGDELISLLSSVRDGD